MSMGGVYSLSSYEHRVQIFRMFWHWHRIRYREAYCNPNDMRVSSDGVNPISIARLLLTGAENRVRLDSSPTRMRCSLNVSCNFAAEFETH